jgi:hypothetical protein
LLGCWFIFHVVSLAREGRLAEPGARAKVGGIAAGLFFLLQPLAVSVTVAGTFDHWRPLVPGWTVENLSYFFLPSLVAHALIFFPRRPAWTIGLLGSLLVLAVELMATRWWMPDAYWRRGLMGALLVLWGVAAWRRWREGARLCGLGALFVMYFSFVALTPRNFLETAAMIGGLTLCAQMVAWFPQRENLRADYLVLALLGLLITGWAGTRWSGTHLEWHAVYEWARASVVEEHVAWFIPWIALKGLIPWAIILWMSGRTAARPYLAHAVWRKNRPADDAGRGFRRGRYLQSQLPGNRHRDGGSDHALSRHHSVARCVAGKSGAPTCGFLSGCGIRFVGGAGKPLLRA